MGEDNNNNQIRFILNGQHDDMRSQHQQYISCIGMCIVYSNNSNNTYKY